jgi:ribosome-binding protein aMBF1 (putative translation factor)
MAPSSRRQPSLRGNAEISQQLCPSGCSALDGRASFVQTRVVAQEQQVWDVRASFARAFRDWRRRNGLPLKTVARDLGLSISTVSSWESGRSFPTGSHFERLVAYTGLPPCKLFCVMADRCVPADCLLALRRISSKRD